jgi:hypothetical protein
MSRLLKPILKRVFYARFCIAKAAYLADLWAALDPRKSRQEVIL